LSVTARSEPENAEAAG